VPETVRKRRQVDATDAKPPSLMLLRSLVTCSMALDFAASRPQNSVGATCVGSSPPPASGTLERYAALPFIATLGTYVTSSLKVRLRVAGFAPVEGRRGTSRRHLDVAQRSSSGCAGRPHSDAILVELVRRSSSRRDMIGYASCSEGRGSTGVPGMRGGSRSDRTTMSPASSVAVAVSRPRRSWQRGARVFARPTPLC